MIRVKSIYFVSSPVLNMLVSSLGISIPVDDAKTHVEGPLGVCIWLNIYGV